MRRGSALQPAHGRDREGDRHEHEELDRDLDERELPSLVEGRIAEVPVEEERRRHAVTVGDEDEAADPEHGRDSDPGDAPQEAGDRRAAGGGAQQEAGEVEPGDGEEDVGTAPALDEARVGGDDRHDGRGSQHDPGLELNGSPAPNRGCGGVLLEQVHGCRVPPRRQSVEQGLEADRRLDVGERVTA